MQSKRARLDRFISQRLTIPRKSVRELLLTGRVTVDGQCVDAMDYQIDEFSRIVFDQRVLQDKQPIYLMLHKPIGVVSATKDVQHKTVIDLLNHPNKADLHIAGRLDLNSSGLLLLTNDSSWSQALMAPDAKVDKVYRVTLANPLTPDYIDAFAKGMYFAFEDVTTLPATLCIESDHVALVTLREGKYHQIKRMFGRFRNPVVALHRLTIGPIKLDTHLAAGESRALTLDEVVAIQHQ